MGIIFSNMHDSMLGELTERRTTGSVPYGGRYRLIDFVLSNMVNSGITGCRASSPSSNYQSLMDHVGAGREWDLARKRGGLRHPAPLREQPGQRHLPRPARGAPGRDELHQAQRRQICASLPTATSSPTSTMREMINEHIKSGAQIYDDVSRRTEVSAESARDTTTLAYDEETKDVTDISVRPDVRGTTACLHERHAAGKDAA